MFSSIRSFFRSLGVELGLSLQWLYYLIAVILLGLCVLSATQANAQTGPISPPLRGELGSGNMDKTHPVSPPRTATEELATENPPRFLTHPQDYDWVLAVFFHMDTPDEEGKTQRRVGYFSFDLLSDCQKKKEQLDNSPTPPNVVLDGTICVPLKKVAFSPVAPNAVPRLPNGKLNLNVV